jgi:4-hydroxybenzoate polyprenyltransferase/phosphoserine phosphatase
MPPAAASEEKSVPLCVDLDGTLIKSDLLWESLVRLLQRNPLYLPLVPLWLARGRAGLKEQLAARVAVDAARLPYHEPFLEFLREERRSGRPIFLVTASDRRMAEPVAAHLGLFAEVIASDGRTNLRGKNKAAKLVERFGERGFDYAGNSAVDLPVWAQSRRALVVNASPGLEARARKLGPVDRVFPTLGSGWRAWLQALRPHQWVKNLIIFVPLVTSHKITQFPLAIEALLAFIAFSLCASAVYVFNDLCDIDADRHHPAKRTRPFAAGALPLQAGLLAAPLLVAAAALLACRLPCGFAVVLALYLFLTTAYSYGLKRIALVDVFCLAGLYTIRLIAGHASTGVVYSAWLLVFSMFIFLSLALVKRFVELDAVRVLEQPAIQGRGYVAGDAELVAALGSASGYMAVLVLALYVNSQEVKALYHQPMLLLLVCPLLLYWISRVWLIAHRSQMHDDPIVFALRDWVSYAVGALSLLVLWLAV